MNDEQSPGNSALVSAVRQLPARAALVNRGIALAERLLHSRPAARSTGERSKPSARIPEPAGLAEEHLRQADQHLERAAQCLDYWHRSYSGRPTTTSAAIFDKAIRELLAGYAEALESFVKSLTAAGELVEDLTDDEVANELTEIVPDSVRRTLLWLQQAEASSRDVVEHARLEHELWRDTYWFEPVEQLNWFLEKVVGPALGEKVRLAPPHEAVS